jgi:glutamine synthetase
MIGYKYGVSISFAPKIVVGHAGSGLHIHTRLIKGGENVMTEGNTLSDLAKRNIAGYLSLAPSLTAFGNTVPISYLRLVPDQEAPTKICWGDRNRSVLVRVPLGWLGIKNMIKDANLLEVEEAQEFPDSQTIEFRCPDGSANIHLLIAGLAVAARHGLEMEDALEFVKKLYIDVNIFHAADKSIFNKLPQLPSSCSESADFLSKDRKIYESDGVFPTVVIDGLIKMLKDYDDRDLRKNYYGKKDEISKLVNEYFHCS